MNKNRYQISKVAMFRDWRDTVGVMRAKDIHQAIEKTKTFHIQDKTQSVLSLEIESSPQNDMASICAKEGNEFVVYSIVPITDR